MRENARQYETGIFDRHGKAPEEFQHLLREFSAAAMQIEIKIPVFSLMEQMQPRGSISQPVVCGVLFANHVESGKT